MQKLVRASLILFILAVLQTKVFAMTLDCKFRDGKVANVHSIRVTDESLIINNQVEIHLEKTKVNCGNFCLQTRLDGATSKFQIILESCSSEAQLEGHLIDSVNEVAEEIFCNEPVESAES